MKVQNFNGKVMLYIILAILILGIVVGSSLAIYYAIQEPIIQLNGDTNLKIEVGNNYEESGAIALKNNKDISNDLEIKSDVDTNKVGNYKVHYLIKGKEYATRNVYVIDDVAPTITLKGNKITNLSVNQKYEEPGYEATDNYDGDITANVQITKENIAEHKYKLIYTAKDSSGNSVSEERIIIENEEPQNQNVIYLTFDDGPSTDITPHILDILKEENVKATFFVLDYTVGSKREELIKREIAEGHTIALHGTSHKYKEIYKSLEDGVSNFTNLNQKIKETTGVDTKIMRFPGGSSNTVSRFNPGIMTKLAEAMLEKGYKYYDWNVSSGDSGDVKTSEAVYSNVTKGFKKGRINMVLMHDFAGNKKTLDALKDIIHFGKENGYTFERITEDTPMITQKIAN